MALRLSPDTAWRMSLELACGHGEGHGTYPSLVDCERVTPRRKDRTFGASFCHRCRRRRRIVSTRMELVTNQSREEDTENGS
jgi:hypothetical protein